MRTLSIATSGLSASSTRLNVAASNVANGLTTGPLPATDEAGASSNGTGAGSNLPAVYVPLQVNQVAQASGSTVATVSTVSPGFVGQSDPAGEFVQMATAKYAFAANAKVIQAASDMTKSLLDITA
jgi:flagellar basal-body rod protein FlgC